MQWDLEDFSFNLVEATIFDSFPFNNKFKASSWLFIFISVKLFTIISLFNVSLNSKLIFEVFSKSFILSLYISINDTVILEFNISFDELILLKISFNVNGIIPSL